MKTVAGLDVHKDSVCLCILQENGESYKLVETDGGDDDNTSSPSEPSSSVVFPTLSDDAPIVFEGD